LSSFTKLTHPETTWVLFEVKNQLPEGVALTNEELLNIRNRALLSGGQVEIDMRLKKTSNSTNSGLRHIHLAATAGGGSFDLKLSESDPTTVVLTVRLPAAVSLTPPPESVMSKSFPSGDLELATLGGDIGHTPCRLRICAIDDSKVCLTPTALLNVAFAHNFHTRSFVSDDM
jgi:hypothetical protein